MKLAFALAVPAAFVPAALADPGAHTDPVTPVALALALILIAAKLGGDLAARIGQPTVLGELVVGVLLGSLHLIGLPWFTFIKDNASIDVLARIGALILLFEVGLESTVGDMMKVGASSLLVAVLGVITPFALGWGVGALLLPDHSVYVHAFLGATLTATSVGITARVLKDLNSSSTAEAKIILGAAVIDDVLGLVILAVVAGLISAADSGRSLSAVQVGAVLGKSVLFLFGALVLGLALSPRLFGFAARLKGRSVLIASALAFCFALAYLAAVVGLAPIVGAYAAGLILEKADVERFLNQGESHLEQLISPISGFLVPVFFVLMGMRVDLGAFARPGVIGLAALLTLAAIAGKQACSLGALGRGIDRLTIGLGMIPRGEVGLIFANVGLGLTVAGERIVDEAIYSAVVIMVIVTTLVTPPALKWSLARRGKTGRREDGKTGRDGVTSTDLPSSHFPSSPASPNSTSAPEASPGS
jgi:Kef-type K+ transport system membrane component KefB